MMGIKSQVLVSVGGLSVDQLLDPAIVSSHYEEKFPFIFCLIGEFSASCVCCSDLTNVFSSLLRDILAIFQETK